MKNWIRNALCAAATGLAAHASSQSTFQNLNFEQAAAYVTPTPVGSWGGFIDPGLAFPGWTTGNAVAFYNDLSLGAPAVCLMGPNFPSAAGYSSLQGSYSVLLQYFGTTPGGAPLLSQTGLVPADARSINFLARPDKRDVTVSLAGVNIPLVAISGGRLAGDVTAFAGTNAQLTFSTIVPSNAGAGAWAYFDDIRFSSSPTPEPTFLAILVVGLLILRFFNRRDGRKQRTIRLTRRPQATAPRALATSQRRPYWRES
jgi:hypothetical protein